MSYIYNLTDTWNAAGTAFNGIKMTITNTASASGSYMLNLSASGATTGSFTVDKSGNAAASGGMTLNTASLGVGTASPAVNLHLYTTGSWPVARLQKAATGYWDFGVINGNDFGIIVNGSASQSSVTLTATGCFGVGNIAPVAKYFQAGTSTSAPLVTTNILSAHNISGTVSYHGFGDESIINNTVAGTAYASFASKVTFDAASAYSYDHFVGAQIDLIYNATTTLTNAYGYYCGLHTNAGTITNLYGSYMVNPAGSGTVTNLYGVYVEDLTKGGTNYAIYTAGTAKSYFGGNVLINTANAGVKLGVAVADGTYQLGLIGTSKGMRFTSTAGSYRMDGVDNTLSASYQPLEINGSTVTLMVGAASALAIASTGVANVCASTATPAGGSTSARLVFGTTAGFGVYYGSGAPTVSAAKGSLYLRSDGTTTNDRMYVNTNGSTTWTAVTTVA